MNFGSDRNIVNRPWPAVQQHIQNTYHIIGHLDFLEIGHDPARMYHTLASYKKEAYLHNEKILIYHYDTDFYLKNHYGIAVYNFLQILKSLDISPSVCLFLTNHHGIEQEIKKFYQEHYYQFDYEADHMTVFASDYVMPHADPAPQAVDISAQSIQSHFICLNGSLRSHRQMLLSSLKHLGVIEKGICTWHFRAETPLTYRITSTDSTSMISCPIPLLTTRPLSRVNDQICWDPNFSATQAQHASMFEQNFQDSRVQGRHNIDHRFSQPAVQQALLYVSTETVFDYPYPYLTEKTYRAILQKRPFVIAGAPGSLTTLRSHGFQTFSQYWDESYDQISDPNQRLNCILGIVQQICALDLDQLRDLCYNMQHILDHNFQHYRDVFAGHDLAKKLKTLQ